MKTQEITETLIALPELPYSFKALEPYIDRETMEVHYKLHHGGYVSNLNKALNENNIHNKGLEEILKSISKYPKEIRNNAGGHYNHSLFWQTIGPDCGGDLTPYLMEAVDRSFNSLENFKREFEKSAMAIFGSGWAWIIVDENNMLKITSTHNQDNPLMDDVKPNGIPILGLDVWEHAYYLKYYNNKAEYVRNFWSIINWEKVDELYKEAVLSKYI